MVCTKIIQSILFIKTVIEVSGLTVNRGTNISVILTTETIIRKSINSIFLNLKLQNIKYNDKITQNTLIHNYFTNLTLRDHTTFEYITKISKVDDYGNSTDRILQIINELLDDDLLNDLDDTITSNINVLHFVDRYLTKQSFKDYTTEIIGNNSIHFIENVLDMIESDLEHAKDDDTSKEGHDDVNDSEVWVPISITRRVYHGQRTKIKYFPFMASVHIFKNFQCGGSIIHTDLVITAASCLQLAWNNRFFRENPAFLSVRVGSTYLSTGGESIPVLEVYFHPSYDPKTLKNNISIMRLRRHLNLKHRRVKKINFDTEAHTLPVTTEGITIVGWGARTMSNILDNPFSNRIAFSVVDFYSFRDCQDVYSREYVSKRNFCAGFLSRGSGACNKDAGDPGIANGKLVGVVSFGSPVCGTPDSPTVFTKLGFYTDWIENIIDMDVPMTKKRTTTTDKPILTMPTFLDTTTFKIAPISGTKLKPIPISEIDALREMNLNELVDKMIEHNEGSDTKVTTPDIMPENLEDTETSSPDEVMQVKPATASINQYAIKEDQSEDESPIDGELIDLLDRPDLKSTSDTEDIRDYHQLKTTHARDYTLEPREFTTQAIDTTEPTEELVEITTKTLEASERAEYKKHRSKSNYSDEMSQIQSLLGGGNDIDESILTLLYLSDGPEDKSEENNQGNKKYERGEVKAVSGDGEGIEIPADEFDDLTFRNNETIQLLDLLPKNEWYDLLTDVVNDVSN